MASKRSLHSPRESTPKRSNRLKVRNDESKENEETEETGQGPSGMSLDVLAQVASETLKNEPNSPKKATKKTTLKNIGCMEVLNLEQIRGLTEKTVLNMFTEVTSNEIARTFTYMCQLMPKDCRKEFSSFGNEMKARAEMKKHLYEHLGNLEKEERNMKTKFTAEPVHVRRKRLLHAFMPTKQKSAKKQKVSNDSENGKEKTNKKVQRSEKKGSETSTEMRYVCKEEFPDKKHDGKVNSIGFVPIPDKLKSNKVSTSQFEQEESRNTHDKSQDSTNENEHRIEENEQFIIDLLSKTQPHHDHCYTTIFGPRQEAETLSRYYKDGLDDEDAEGSNSFTYTDYDLEYLAGNKRVMYLDTNGCAVKNPTPILFLRHRSPDENVPMVSVECIIPQSTDDEEEVDVVGGIDLGEISLSSGEKPYPPMPKSVLAKRGRLGFDITDIPPDGSEEEMVFLRKKKTMNPLSREGREGNLGWEPKLALKYIRELKSRKKDENIPLICKICQDKTFTAAATLMYHYRSHAGIKPFVCLICNTTFTRQHSLNYHMLIHNNQSRFTCKDCGRKFRHPSHFKEHLRRHTGETPFECRDCGQKFKTRNTYKRHLKTRHGKLLTASGIHQLSLEEFAKVRTKKYNIPRLPDISYQMPELTFTKMKRKRSDRDTSYPNLPDISYEMPELLFTKLKKKRENKDFTMVDFNKLKSFDEIKKEVDSDTEDPELKNVLQVLSGHEALKELEENLEKALRESQEIRSAMRREKLTEEYQKEASDKNEEEDMEEDSEENQENVSEKDPEKISKVNHENIPDENQEKDSEDKQENVSDKYHEKDSEENMEKGSQEKENKEISGVTSATGVLINTTFSDSTSKVIEME